MPQPVGKSTKNLRVSMCRTLLAKKLKFERVSNPQRLVAKKMKNGRVSAIQRVVTSSPRFFDKLCFVKTSR